MLSVTPEIHLARETIYITPKELFASAKVCVQEVNINLGRQKKNRLNANFCTWQSVYFFIIRSIKIMETESTTYVHTYNTILSPMIKENNRKVKQLFHQTSLWLHLHTYNGSFLFQLISQTLQ